MGMGMSLPNMSPDRGEVCRMSIEFLLTSLVVVIAPGIGVLYTLSCGLSHGRSASVAAAFGCTMGILPHMTAAILGLATLLQASAVAFQMLKYAGLAYLLYLAWRSLNDSEVLAVDKRIDRRSAVGIAVKGVLINILNPKLSIFFLAFLPQFIPADGANPALAMTGLGVVFMIMTFVVFVGYGVFAAALRRYVIDRAPVMKWIRRVFAASFVALGVKLVLSEK